MSNGRAQTYLAVYTHRTGYCVRPAVLCLYSASIQHCYVGAALASVSSGLYADERCSVTSCYLALHRMC